MTAIHFTPEQRRSTANLLYEIGHRLQIERTARGKSLRHIEALSGVDDNQIGRMERGVLAHVCLATVLKLLRVYKLTLAIVPLTEDRP